MKLNVLESQCDCETCSDMCQAPCCGTPEEMKKLIDSGYGSRLMYDDWAGGPELLKPALKGYESQGAPFDTSSINGCTFWKEGKCELHNLGLKPLGGRIAHHDQTDENYDKMKDYLNIAWETKEAKELNKYWVCEYLKNR